METIRHARRAPRGARLFFLLPLAACGLTSASTADQARAAAQVLADVSDATQKPLADAYRLEGLACVDAARDAGADGLEARARDCFARVDAAWAPVWQARGLVVTAQHALADALNKGQSGDAQRRELAADYCQLRAGAQPRIALPSLGLCP